MKKNQQAQLVDGLIGIVISLSFSDAFRESSGSVIIDLEVTPASGAIQVPSGYNPWRKRIEVRLSRPAQQGKANRQLIKELSEVLGIKASDIILVSGQTSHKKTVEIKGITRNQIIDLFTPLIEKID